MGANAKNMALCGVLAALGVVFMCMGTLIPLATFVCPVLCMVVLNLVLRFAGRRWAWSWYICVGILAILLAPDKEAAAVFAFIGYYPILKPWMDRSKLSLLWKLLFFNASILVTYWLLMYLFGMEQLVREFTEYGSVYAVITLVLGNICMLSLDVVLSKVGKMK